MFENLWRKTASVLEREVPINSITKVISCTVEIEDVTEVKTQFSGCL